jgi:hypothetical protein
VTWIAWKYASGPPSPVEHWIWITLQVSRLWCMLDQWLTSPLLSYPHQTRCIRIVIYVRRMIEKSLTSRIIRNTTLLQVPTTYYLFM